MSLAKAIVLTRDQRASEKFAQRLGRPVIIAPVRQLHLREIDPPIRPDLYIATSANIAHVLSHIPKAPFAVVGERTKNVLEEAEFDVTFTGRNAQDLRGFLTASSPMQICYLRGAIITAHFYKLGHEVQEIIVYEMAHRDWSECESAAIESIEQAAFPVFSYTSAQSLLKNLNGLSSHFCGQIFPLSYKIAEVFENFPSFQSHSIRYRHRDRADIETLIMRLRAFLMNH